MKCPYAINIEQIVQDTYTYEDGNTTVHQSKLVERRTYVECLQEECAVWVDGRCNYNQGHNG
jgi:hypothetical protein